MIGEDAIPAENRVERRAQLVRHHREKLVLRVIRGFRALARVTLVASSLLQLCDALRERLDVISLRGVCSAIGAGTALLLMN